MLLLEPSYLLFVPWSRLFLPLVSIQVDLSRTFIKLLSFEFWILTVPVEGEQLQF